MRIHLFLRLIKKRAEEIDSLFLLLLCRLKLKALHRFTSTATAVEDITAIQKGKLGKGLKQFLTDEVLEKGKGKESLVVIDPHLGLFLILFFRIC